MQTITHVSSINARLTKHYSQCERETITNRILRMGITAVSAGVQVDEVDFMGLYVFVSSHSHDMNQSYHT